VPDVHQFIIHHNVIIFMNSGALCVRIEEANI